MSDGVNGPPNGPATVIRSASPRVTAATCAEASLSTSISIAFGKPSGRASRDQTRKCGFRARRPPRAES